MYTHTYTSYLLCSRYFLPTKQQYLMLYSINTTLKQLCTNSENRNIFTYSYVKSLKYYCCIKC